MITLRFKSIEMVIASLLVYNAKILFLIISEMMLYFVDFLECDNNFNWNDRSMIYRQGNSFIAITSNNHCYYVTIYDSKVKSLLLLYPENVILYIEPS